jgi:type I site-specific restriction-modification system R (restriction) subunit
MAFYSGQIIKHPVMQNPTLVALNDRNDLDDQLFGTFSMCKDLLRQTPIQPHQASAHRCPRSALAQPGMDRIG